MGILQKLFTGSGSKLGARIKQVQRALAAGKLDESQAQFEELWAQKPPDLPDGDLNDLRDLREELFRARLNAGQQEQALKLAAEAAQDNNGALLAYAKALVEREVVHPLVLELVQQAAEKNPNEKRLLLSEAKLVLDQKGEELEPGELEFLIATAKAFPLWKEGLSFLADRYLREGRRDAEALAIYRGAYPNRKADRRLRSVLLESLIENEEHDEFAAAVYKDAVETSENAPALKLLASYYIANDDFSPSTLPYLERALEKTKLPEDTLKNLSTLVLNSRSDYVDHVALSLAIYRQGYSDRNLLTFLSDRLAQQSKFDDEAIQIMTQAFELRQVTKRAILILTEHCLANEREDEFALRVYENYLSTWPDRPQRRIYSILAHHYADQTRVDEQAQKIYEEALEDSPTDPVVVTILARAYHAADRRDAAAEQVYRHAFPLVEGEVKTQLAIILAEMKLEANDYGEDTLQYLTVMGRPTTGVLADRYDEALTNCFLATGRRGEQAQAAYFTLFKKTEDSAELNPRLVALLAEIIKERGTVPPADSVEIRVYRKLFELQKFSTDADIAFILLEDQLKAPTPELNLVHIGVRCFEADAERFVKVTKELQHEGMLLEIGDFYIEHYNFTLAAQAYEAGFVQYPTDETRYRLAKIHLLEGRPDRALELLKELSSPEFARKRQYWEAAAYQQQGNAKRSRELLVQLSPNGDIPAYLVQLRQAINDELIDELERSLAVYEDLVEQEQLALFHRWIQLERGIVLMKLQRLEDARHHLEEVHRRNPNGRAEQLFCSLAYFFLSHLWLSEDRLADALPLFTRAVEVNRNHRLLRQVIVDVLSLHGERSFFAGKLERAAQILEVAHRILPKRVATKTLLAYTYHRMEDYSKAIIYYRDISWSDDNPRLERSQAYAYMANNQPEKAWRVFLDLAKRGNLLKENFLRAVSCFLKDRDATGGQAWQPVEFDKNLDGVFLSALLIHDGLYKRAVELLGKLLAKERQNLQLHWYLGKAYSCLDKRELAVHNWKELKSLCLTAASSPATKIRQLTEIGLAFVGAGYAQEAMQTWEELRELDEKNPDLPGLYAVTLDLNAYQLARKEQNKMAREEWKKALRFAPDNPSIMQNYAIANLLVDDLDEATRQFHKLGQRWQELARQGQGDLAEVQRRISQLERAINTLQLTKGRPEFDLTKVRAEDAIDVMQRANQFYWILGLDKTASRAQIENEYFRLIKIFNPERHADDFMLVEESYTNLFKSEEQRERFDLFVYNPVDIEDVRAQLRNIPRDGGISFEQLDLPSTIPAPDYQQLEPSRVEEEELAQPLEELLTINFKIPDWTVL